MKWAQPHDYHSSRIYGADQPPVSQLKLSIAWLANIVARKLARRSPAKPPFKEQRGYSTLGADHVRTTDPRIASQSSFVGRDRRDCRVLP